MVGTSKILTVSYGTFSCTLEGLDDSFNTMKAIAEYFRGLASDDRYFGAEPPTPDAEMLAKIAEREISRRVDATMDDGGIVLRAAALTDQSDDTGDAPVHDDASRAKVDAERKAAKAARKAEKAAAKARAKEARKAELNAKAEAKAAAEVQEQADVEAQSIADAQIAFDQNSIEMVTSDEGSTLESVSAATADASEGTTEPDVEETRDDAPSSMLAASGSAPENTGEADDAPADVGAPVDVPAHPDTDSVAAKLQRIRAVVGKSDAKNDDPSDDLTEQFLPQTQAQDVADVEPETQDDVAVSDDAAMQSEGVEDMVEAEDAQPQEAPAADDMISRVMARHSDAEAVETDTSNADVALVDTAVAEEDDTSDPPAEQPRARVVRMKRADFEKAMAEEAAQKAQDDKAAGPDFGLLDGADDLDDYLEDSDFTDDISILDDVDLAEDLQAIQDDASGDAAADTDDAGDETMNAVANAMSDQDTPKDEEPQVNQVGATDFMSTDADVDDAALDRLMNETDAQMQEPEGSRRHDAISQLKAAVAAKEAARQVGEPEDDGQDVENAFRNDLSEAVNPAASAKPRPRPVVRSTTSRTERPRPAPLKLVAAQRVDVEDGAQDARRDTPVVPCRVAARKEDASEPRASGSFAEFADKMGASELRDLLEAAAAYTSFVEGADEFSRPQILRRVRAVAADDFKREDELRSFAELISAGRFTKVRNGRFQVADDSHFNPERRAG